MHSKPKGWLAPSVEVKIQEHITAICRICGLLPVGKVVVETGEFDQELLKAVADGKPEGWWQCTRYLVTLCEVCHKKFHKGLITNLKLKKRSRVSTRDVAFMGIMRQTLMERLRKELEGHGNPIRPQSM